MADIKRILEDEREIVTLFFDDPRGSCIDKGHLGITEIKAYGETGEYCNVPWLAVMRGEEIWQRIPVGHVRIVYA